MAKALLVGQAVVPTGVLAAFAWRRVRTRRAESAFVDALSFLIVFPVWAASVGFVLV